ncbi:OmpA family protein [Bacteroidota bacterium]
MKSKLHIFAYFTWLIFASVSIQVNAQETKPSKLRKQAILSERYGDINAAIVLYTKYINQSKAGAFTMYHIAELYQQLRNYEMAKRYYLLAYEMKPGKYGKALFYYAVMQKMTCDYEGAIERFSTVRKKLKGKGENAEYRKLARTEIEGCELAKTLLEKESSVEIELLNSTVNNDHVDYAPFPLNDTTLIYASVHADKVIRYFDNEEIPDYCSSFYLAKKRKDNWHGGIPVMDSFNMPGLNVGNGVLCPHKTRFYFTVCNKNEENKNICAIYYSELKKGKWQSPVKLEKPVNLPNFTSTQPAVGIESRHNEEVLYFVSDRPGGRGGLDVWYTIFSNKTYSFSEPRNLGGKVNTEGDEMSPFYDQESRRLYFSSNGLVSIGGLDIFKTTGELRRWEDPENMGYPLNSCADDIYFVLNSENKSQGFFVSNRSGGNSLENETCCDDIYSFNIPDYIHIILKGKIVALEDTGKVQYIDNLISENPEEAFTGGKVSPNTVVSLYLYTADQEQPELLVKTDTTDQNGKYSFKLEAGNQYRVKVIKDGYFSRKREVSTLQITRRDTLIRDLYIYKIPEKPIIIRNIYYPFDKYYLTDTAKAMIDSTILILMQENPQIIAEISSHTDSKGTDDYNMKLSQKRAQSVVDYLIQHGVSKDRLQAKGYGETIPIDLNTLPDGSDNPEGRQKNRRTEFKVIGTLPQFSEIIYEE